MQIEVNGEARDVAEGMNLGELVATLSLPPERVAVEHNREVVPRGTWAERRLAADDKIEIVHFVGGGQRRI